LRGVRRECVGEQWTKGRVELLSSPSSWAILRAVLRGFKRRIVLRLLSCFVGGVCFGLPRHGLPRRWVFRGVALRGVVLRGTESCETWSLPRHGLARLGGEKLGGLPGSAWHGGGGVEVPSMLAKVTHWYRILCFQMFFSSSSCDCARLTMMAVRYCRWCWCWRARRC
jgi:hypothetical protein